MRQMDSYRGSSPPSFISFHLENQIPENDAATNPPVASPPVSANTTIIDPQTIADILTSTRSADSEQDINAYAETKIQSIKSVGLSSNVGLVALAAEAGSETQTKDVASQGLPPVVMLRSSTPIPTTDELAASTSLAA